MEQAIFTTMCMVCDNQNRVLLQERTGTAWDGIAFPGGHVELGESFVESVIREIKEETGYRIQNPILCGVKQFQKEKQIRYVILLYKATQFDGELCPSEEGDVFWVDRSQMDSLPLAHDMKELTELFDDSEKSEFYYLPDGTFKLL